MIARSHKEYDYTKNTHNPSYRRDAENRAAMVKVLEGAEYKVLETDNGQQALDIINEEDIDILVTDLRLPIMDGVELLKRAKAVEQDLEVIMITGHGTVEIAVEMRKTSIFLLPTFGFPSWMASSS